MLLPDKGFWLYTYKGGGFIPIKVRALYLLSFFRACRPPDWVRFAIILFAYIARGAMSVFLAWAD
jgi:hypothetical protein